VLGLAQARAVGLDVRDARRDVRDRRVVGGGRDLVRDVLEADRGLGIQRVDLAVGDGGRQRRRARRGDLDFLEADGFFVCGNGRDVGAKRAGREERRGRGEERKEDKKQ